MAARSTRLSGCELSRVRCTTRPSTCTAGLLWPRQKLDVTIPGPCRSSGIVGVVEQAVAADSSSRFVKDHSIVVLHNLSTQRLPLASIAGLSGNDNHLDTGCVRVGNDTASRSRVRPDVHERREQDANKPWVHQLVAAYQSPEVKLFILSRYKGAMIPAF